MHKTSKDSIIFKRYNCVFSIILNFSIFETNEYYKVNDSNIYQYHQIAYNLILYL